MSVIMFSNTIRAQIGMGLEHFREFSLATARASELLGIDLLDIVTNNPENKLFIDKFNQPMIFVLNALTFFDLQRRPHRIDFTMGHSMGELNALHASGHLSMEDCLRFIKITAADSAFTDPKFSKRLCVLQGPPPERVKELFTKHEVQGIIFSCINRHDQMMLGGTEADYQVAKAKLKEEKEITLFSLARPSFGWHSYPGLTYQNRESLNVIESMQIHGPKYPMYSCMLNRPVASSDDVKRILKGLAFEPLDWKSGIEFMLDHKHTDFMEPSFGDMLTGFVNAIKAHRSGIN